MGKEKIFNGIIDSNLKMETSQRGRPYLKFILKTKDSLLSCMAFEETANQIIDNYTPGETCSVIGSQGTTDEQVFVNYFRCQKIEGDRIIRLYGSHEKYKKYHEAVEAEMLRKGRIKVRDELGHYYAREKDCVLHNGSPKTKINYVMDVLGTEYVLTEMRKNLNLIRGDVLGLTRAVKDKTFTERYQAFLGHLVNMAKEKEGPGAYEGCPESTP